jgi:hypothetical protein
MKIANRIIEEINKKEIAVMGKALMGYLSKFKDNQKDKKMKEWFESKDFSDEDAKKIKDYVKGKS